MFHTCVILHTQRVTARQLRLLRIASGKFVANAIEKLYVALLGILLERCDKGPRHGASGLSSNRCIGPRLQISVRVLQVHRERRQD